MLSVPALARELGLPSMLGSLSLLTLSTLASARELPRPQTKVYFDISIGGEASGRVSVARDLACRLRPCHSQHGRATPSQPLPRCPCLMWAARHALSTRCGRAEVPARHSRGARVSFAQITIGLFDKQVPKTAANFKELCAGLGFRARVRVAARAISVGEVAALQHEVWDDPVELAALVAEAARASAPGGRQKFKAGSEL